MRNTAVKGRRSRCGVLLLLFLLATMPLRARELAVPPADLLPAEFVAVQQLADAGMAVMLLRVGGHDLPMFTGLTEAAAIDRAMRKLRPPRALTHELLGDVLEATGWRLERLVIDELDAGQFKAALELTALRGGTRRMVDSRPSDGLVLALRHGAPIVVARQVLEAAAEEELRRPGQAGKTLTAATD
jgi:uncharacterized protein